MKSRVCMPKVVMARIASEVKKDVAAVRQRYKSAAVITYIRW